MEGKVSIDAGTNVFNAHSVYRACSRLDDLQTFGHVQMKTFHQAASNVHGEGLSPKAQLCELHVNTMMLGPESLSATSVYVLGN